MPSTTAAPPPLALIACRVLHAELTELARDAPHLVHQEFFPLGLHDRPAELHATLAAALARAEADPRVAFVALAYGLCGLATVDLAPRRCPLVLPRAHDCITLLLGSKERYAACMHAEPGTYWYSPGWNHAGRAAGPDRTASLKNEYTARYGTAAADALLAIEHESLAHHTCGAYVDLGLAPQARDRTYAAHCARSLGWRCETHTGDPTLLRDLLAGRWHPDRFLVVHPGERIAHSVDDAIIRAAPVAPT